MTVFFLTFPGLTYFVSYKRTVFGTFLLIRFTAPTFLFLNDSFFFQVADPFEPPERFRITSSFPTLNLLSLSSVPSEHPPVYFNPFPLRKASDLRSHHPLFLEELRDFLTDLLRLAVPSFAVLPTKSFLFPGTLRFFY